MRHSVCFLLLIGTVAASRYRVTVDRNNCIWRAAAYSHFLECDSGYVAVGGCGSGTDANCNNNAQEMKCCKYMMNDVCAGNITQDVEIPAEKYCSLREGYEGHWLMCNQHESIFANCASQGDADCGQNIWERTMCCKVPYLSHSILSTPQRSVVRYGIRFECPEDAVLCGKCGSGGAPLCNHEGNNGWTGFACCTLSTLG